MRVGCDVRLYHDAHQTPGPVPDVLLGDGQPYMEHSCWDEVYAAIEGARRFIFITGWSVWVNTVLKRVPNSDCECPALGELLKSKAEEGVRVRIGVLVLHD